MLTHFLNEQASSRQADAVALLEASAALPFTTGEQVARTYRAAEVAAESELDERAVSLSQKVLAVEPKHEGAITLLSGLHEKVL